MAGQKNLRHPRKDMPPVNIDAVLIERLLWNLIENAIKYSPADAPIEIAAKGVGTEIEISVCDRGTGIDQKRKAQLFELFQRGKTESKIPGVGLGLSIVKTIIDSHGGNISAENREGGGSCFRIRLPLGNPPAFDELDGKA